MKKQIYLDRNQIPSPGLDNDIIQDALNQCRSWGGEVILSPGTWRISSIRLFSDTTLRLQSGCHILGSTNYEDYIDWGFESTLNYLKSPEIVNLWQLPPDYVKAMITAVEAENVAIIGELGTTINGQDCRNPYGEEGFRLKASPLVCKALTEQYHAGKRVAAICAAPSVLGSLEFLRGRRATCYPGFEPELLGALHVSDPVVTDGIVTTATGLGTAIPFALELVSLMVSPEKAAEVGAAIQYKA